MSNRVAVVLLTLALGWAFMPPAAAEAQGAANVRSAALARVGRAQVIAADPQVRSAVLAKNARHESLREVHQKDKLWTENPQDPLRQALSTDACAERLRELIKDDPLVVEAILMDAQGANVCVSPATSDYWQGDEPKFQQIFVAGKSVFLDEPALDASTGAYALQLSVLVADGRTKAGVLTLTLRVRKEDAQAATP